MGSYVSCRRTTSQGLPYRLLLVRSFINVLVDRENSGSEKLRTSVKVTKPRAQKSEFSPEQVSVAVTLWAVGPCGIQPP